MDQGFGLAGSDGLDMQPSQHSVVALSLEDAFNNLEQSATSILSSLCVREPAHAGAQPPPRS